MMNPRRGLADRTKSLVRRLSDRLTSPEAALLVGEPVFRMMGRRGPGRDIDLSSAKQVLVVRLDEIGDVVMTTPFLRELRRNLPQSWITLVVKPAVHNLMELCPYVDEVLTYDCRVSVRLPGWRQHWRALRLAHSSLWSRRFDLALSPRRDRDYYHGAFILYLSGAPRRVGSSWSLDSSERPGPLQSAGSYRLMTHVCDCRGHKHEVPANLEMIRSLGGRVEDDRLELWFDDQDEAFAGRLLEDRGIGPGDNLIALGPGAGASKRRWPAGRFTELGLWLKRELGARLLVVGGPGEKALGGEIGWALGDSVVNCAGRTTLRQTGALLKRCRLFIGNDAGPMHMAAAVGLPVVELSCHPETGSPWSANSPLRFGPWGGAHTVIQPENPRPPCVDECGADHPHCILGITTRRIRSSLVPYLQSGGGRPAHRAGGVPGQWTELDQAST
jgi:heptosyltransferase-2